MRLSAAGNILLSFTLIVLASASPLSAPLKSTRWSKDLRSRSVGADSAASDLYGLGIRLGIYFQATGALLALGYQDQVFTITSLLVNMAAVLISWSIFASRLAFSVSEAYLILVEVTTLGLPLTPLAISISKGRESEGTRTVCVAAAMAVVLWGYVDFIVLFSGLRHRLPMLGTKGTGWMMMYGNGDLVGYAGKNILILLCIALPLMAFVFLATALGATAILWKWLRKQTAQPVEEQPTEAHRLRVKPLVVACVLLPLHVFLIVSCEETIKSNGLSPETDIAKPGQVIPQCIETLVLCCSLTAMVKQLRQVSWAEAMERGTANLQEFDRQCEEYRQNSAHGFIMW